MDNFTESRDQQLDDQLSEFADQVISSDENEAKVQGAIDQGELAQLQKTILRMKNAVQAARMSGAANARIRTRLLEEWNKTKQTEHPTQKRIVWNWSLTRIALVGGVAILIIFSAVLLTLPTTALTGVANRTEAWPPIFILVSIIVIVLILWCNRNN